MDAAAGPRSDGFPVVAFDWTAWKPSFLVSRSAYQTTLAPSVGTSILLQRSLPSPCSSPIPTPLPSLVPQARDPSLPEGESGRGNQAGIPSGVKLQN
jgi:hypothetical protein